MSNKTELLPCPFCGGAAPEVRMIGNDHTKSRKVTIRCPSCRIERTDAALRHGHDWLLTVATEHWNQRPAVAHADAVSAARNEALEQAAKECERVGNNPGAPSQEFYVHGVLSAAEAIRAMKNGPKEPA